MESNDCFGNTNNGKERSESYQRENGNDYLRVHTTVTVELQLLISRDQEILMTVTIQMKETSVDPMMTAIMKVVMGQ
ncbi:MAG: hypothetical protein M3R25_03525 [Bacteroidota bacterium]|nr:hypothetical protein [Bacteroidota bacterium]